MTLNDTMVVMRVILHSIAAVEANCFKFTEAL